MRFFEKWFQGPKQPNEEEVIRTLPDSLRGLLMRRKYEEGDSADASVLGNFETANAWWTLAKQNPSTVRSFEKELAAVHDGSLPEWYQPLSLGRHVIEPLHELEADFQNLRTERQRHSNSPIGGGGEVTPEMRDWYKRVQEIGRRAGEKKLHQDFMELEKNLNLKLISREEYNEGVERLEEEYQHLQASLDVSDATIRELADIQNINRLQESFSFLAQDWIDSLRDEAGQIDPELAGMIAADVMMRKLRALLEDSRNPGAIELNQAISGWMLLDGRGDLSALEEQMEVWQKSKGDRLKFSVSEVKAGRAQAKLQTIRKLLDDTLPVVSWEK